MPDQPTLAQTSSWKIALAVSVAHGTNDAYAAFLAPLLPRLMDNLGLSITLAATLAMILSLAASVLQPAMGYFADRVGPRYFVVVGPVISAVFLSMIGLAPSFAILVLLLALGGLGSAVFHPPGAAMATRVGEGKGSGLRLSLFSVGGALGFAIGPLLVVWIVSWRGLEGMWVAVLPMLVIAPLVFWVLPAGPPRNLGTRAPPSPRKVLSYLAGPLGLVFGISAVGAFGQRVFITMEPIIINQAGLSEAAGAATLSAYFFAQAGGTLMGGYLTDRVNRAKLLAVLTLLAAPFHFVAVGMQPGTSLFFLVIMVAGFINMAILPPVVVMAQELVPAGASVSAGIAMGLAWTAGSIGVLGTGVLGDLLGARSAALISMPVFLLGTVLALHPSLREHARRPHAPAG